MESKFTILLIFIATLLITLFLMYTGLIICIPLFLLLVLVIILLYISSNKRYLIGEFQNTEIHSFQENVIQTLKEQGYHLKIKNEKIYIEKGILTATRLIFQQDNQQVNVYRTNAATITAWILFILGVLLFILGAIVVGYISENNSKKFAEEEIIPLLNNKRCDNCGKRIPSDSKICPYCAKRY